MAPVSGGRSVMSGTMASVPIGVWRYTLSVDGSPAGTEPWATITSERPSAGHTGCRG